MITQSVQYRWHFISVSALILLAACASPTVPAGPDTSTPLSSTSDGPAEPVSLTPTATVTPSAEAAGYLDRGNAHYKNHDYQSALADYSQAIELDPNYASAYINRGVVYAHLGKPDLALKDYDRAILLDPNNGLAVFQRGITYYDMGDLDRAVADFTKVIEISPDFAEAYSNRGLVYSDQGYYDRAIADFDKTIKLSPRMVEISFTYFNRGHTYYQKGDYKSAMPDLDTAISLNPNYARPYLLRGVIFAELEERDKAISDLQTAIDLGLIPNEEQQARFWLDKLRK